MKCYIKRKFYQVAVFALFLGGIFSSLRAMADVNPGQSIQAAISASPVGGTDKVNPGSYHGTISGKSGVTVRFTGTALLTTDGDGAVWDFNSISNMTIEGPWIADGTNNRPGGGIYLNGSSRNNRFVGGEIRQMRNQGVLVQPDSGSNFFGGGLSVHHNGLNGRCPSGGPGGGYCHGFYIISQNNVFDGVRANDNDGYGLQIYGGGNIVRNFETLRNGNGGVGTFAHSDYPTSTGNCRVENGRAEGNANSQFLNTAKNTAYVCVVGSISNINAGTFTQTGCGGTTPPTPIPPIPQPPTVTPLPPPTDPQVSQNGGSYIPPSTGGGTQPSGPSTSQVAVPFLIAGVIGAALLLGSD